MINPVRVEILSPLILYSIGLFKLLARIVIPILLPRMMSTPASNVTVINLFHVNENLSAATYETGPSGGMVNSRLLHKLVDVGMIYVSVNIFSWFTVVELELV